MYKKAQTTTLICLLIFLASHTLIAQKGIYLLPSMDSIPKTDIAEIVDNYELFDSDEVLELSITADFKELIKTKNNDSTYREAEFSYQLNDTVLVRNELKIKPRGNYRRKNCAFPPLMLNFKKTEFLVSASRDFDKLKMVSICRETKTNQQYIFKEYLVYKMFNILSEYSLKTRLISLFYDDTGGKLKIDTTYAFIIEPIDALAKRLNSMEIKSKVPHQDMTDYDYMNFVAVFQFMIGNLDWSVAGLHNIYQLKSNDANQQSILAVPYDFDFTGFVNTSYALPPPQLSEQVETVRDRLFRGFSRTPEQYEAAFEIFRDKQDEIIELIDSFPYLTKSTRTDVRNFIDEFYQIIDSEYQVKRYFIDGCRKT